MTERVVYLPVSGEIPYQGFQIVELEAHEREAYDVGLFEHETIVHDLMVEDLLREHALAMAA